MSFEKIIDAANEIKEHSPIITNFDIDRRIDVDRDVISRDENKFDVDKRLPRIADSGHVNDIETITEDVFCERTELFSSLQERTGFTPLEGRERGDWKGARGESEFVPSYSFMKEHLSEYGLEGIQYKNGVPDFSKVSDTTVTIDNMTTERYGNGGNFEQADTAAAKIWSAEKRDGRDDWSARDVADWRAAHKMSWHERSDMVTMDLVPYSIHQYFSHSGGVYECRKRDSQEVMFDA